MGTLMKVNVNYKLSSSHKYLYDSKATGYEHRFTFELKDEVEINGELYEANNEALQKVRMLKGDLYGEELAGNELDDDLLEVESGGRDET